MESYDRTSMMGDDFLKRSSSGECFRITRAFVYLVRALHRRQLMVALKFRPRPAQCGVHTV